jgi:hypothetical protein
VLLLRGQGADRAAGIQPRAHTVAAQAPAHAAASEPEQAVGGGAAGNA